MNDDRLVELLRQTDEALPSPPGGPADLAARVRRKAAHRRAMRLTGGAVAAAIALAFAGVFLFRAAPQRTGPHRPSTPLDAVPVASGDSREELARLRAELDQLRADVDATLAMVKAVKAQQQEMRVAEMAQAMPDPQEQIRRELDQAAFTLVYQADRMYRELGLKQSAIRDYRQVIELYPATPSAQVARERLARIEANQGDRL